MFQCGTSGQQKVQFQNSQMGRVCNKLLIQFFGDVVAVHLNIAAYAIVFCQDAAGFVWQLQLAHARRQEL